MFPWRTVLVFGGVAACAVAVVRLSELGLYIAVPSVVFLGLGLWLGLRSRARHAPVPVLAASPVAALTAPDPEAIAKSGLSRRELDVLERAAAGLSNQEIADALFISLSTVKTHLNNVFIKLDVKRRTQAVSKARELGLIA
jgi:DNA-binding CsgD family transcriptional regulator